MLYILFPIFHLPPLGLPVSSLSAAVTLTQPVMLHPLSSVCLSIVWDLQAERFIAAICFLFPSPCSAVYLSIPVSHTRHCMVLQLLSDPGFLTRLDSAP